jgi:endonuclease/exonuclease/phosphatase family metal-dependent hydrolase
LKPSTPTNVAVSIAHGAVSLHWSGGAGTGYVVERSPTANFASVSRSYTLIGPGQQFTPPDLTNGTPYYFRVRAVNTGTKSSPSAAVAGNNSVGTTPITTVTYNIREASLDSQPDGKNHGAPWDQRKGPEASLLRTASPDVVAIEEGASYVDGSSTERQADSLTAALGNPYAIANTEIPAPQKHHFRTGDYIIYNSNTVQPIGQGGHWDLGEANLGHQHWAAYQEFRCVGTGAKFLFVAFHLVVVNNGVTDDRARQRQTESMIQQAESFAAGPNLPIVYAGDTNSAVESSHPLDGPRVAMRAHQIADAFDVAASRHHTQYNTGNQYYPKPPASHIYLDAIFAAPGVGVASWDELLKLSHGRFVLPIPSDHNPVVARVVIPG